MNTKQHKPGCMACMFCAVDHGGQPCPGPYGKCTCDEKIAPLKEKGSWIERFDKFHATNVVMHCLKCEEKIKAFIQQEKDKSYEEGKREGKVSDLEQQAIFGERRYQDGVRDAVREILEIVGVDSKYDHYTDILAYAKEKGIQIL
jgi:hypothetical protein